MVKGLLVMPDFVLGTKYLKALDDAGLAIKVAALVYTDRYQDWRLLLASPQIDKRFGEGIKMVLDAFDNAGVVREVHTPLMIRKMSDPMIRELRQYRKLPDAEGFRIGPQGFGNEFIEDGIIYRVK
jgi:hypothetical protein